MKKFFLILLFANIVYLMWEITLGHHDIQSSNVSVESGAKRNRIVLVDETLGSNGINPESTEDLTTETSNTAIASSEIFIADMPKFNDMLVSASVENALLSNVNDDLEQETKKILSNKGQSVVPDNLTLPSIDGAIKQPVDLGVKAPFCYRIGPWTSRSSIRKVANGLFRKGYTSDSQSKLLDIKTGYMVYLPAAASYAESRKNLRSVRDKGLKDVWIFQKGEERGTISLGRFKERDRAIAMKKKLQSISVGARIKATYSKTKGYFLTFRWQGPTEEFKKMIEDAGVTTNGLERLPIKTCS